MKEESTLQELAIKYEVHTQQISLWKKQLLEGADKGAHHTRTTKSATRSLLCFFANGDAKRYQYSFKELVIGKLPDESDLIGSLLRVTERLKTVEWDI